MAYGDALAALADPTRRTVLELLRRGPRPVGELARELPVSRPAVSQHLRVLKRAGLVRERRSGTRNIYSVDDDGLRELRDYLEGFWDEALASFKEAAEREEDEEFVRPETAVPLAPPSGARPVQTEPEEEPWSTPPRRSRPS